MFLSFRCDPVVFSLGCPCIGGCKFYFFSMFSCIVDEMKKSSWPHANSNVDLSVRFFDFLMDLDRLH